MFGCTSMWYLFYSRAGAMMKTADALAGTIDIYNRLTGDHGAGAAELYLEKPSACRAGSRNPI
ncbi:MAG: hypothetical protein V8Q42_09180 [Anaerovoracaceae bacterium]